ncbi:MAG: hypothetical protein HY851_04585, partial [candidate division Zixibacteria bacterium]|nr:hypothetical protein [candidate division Zixibacteria bacterium]
DSYISYTIRPTKTVFETITPSTYIYRRWSFDGQRLNAWNDFNLEAGLRVAQTFARLSYRDAFESYADVPFSGLYSLQGSIESQPHRAVTVSANLGGGTTIAYFLPVPERANELSGGVAVSVKPIDRLTIDSRVQTYRISDRAADTAYFDGYIARSRLQFQATRALSVRLVGEYNDFRKAWSISPLMTYRISPFSLFYIGSTLNYTDWPTTLSVANAPTEWKLDQRQYFMKLQYLFQV